MKTQILTGLAFIASAMIGQPVYAHSEHGGHGGGHVAGGGHGGGGHAAHVASSHGGGGGHGHSFAAGGHSSHANHVASNRNFTVPVERGIANSERFNTHRNFSSNRNINSINASQRTSVALAGTGFQDRNGRGNFRGHGGGGPQYAFASHDGWNHNREYNWNGHLYRWINDGWFVIDPWIAPDTYGYQYNYGPSYYDSDSAAVQVQQDLAHDGYYNGPIDGVVGPGTRSAIAAYQRDNGLPVTGSVSLSLLDSLNGQ